MKKFIFIFLSVFLLQDNLNGMQHAVGTEAFESLALEVASVRLLNSLFRDEVDSLDKAKKLIKSFEKAFLPKKGSDPFIKGFVILLEKLLCENEKMAFSFKKTMVGGYYSHDFCEKMLNAIISKLVIRSLTFEKNFEKLFITKEKTKKAFSKKYLKMLNDVFAIVVKNSINKGSNDVSPLAGAIAEYTAKKYSYVTKFLEQLRKDFDSSKRWNEDNIVWMKYFGKKDRPQAYKKLLDEKKILPITI